MKHIWALLALPILLCALFVPYREHGHWTYDDNLDPVPVEIAARLDEQHFGSRREVHPPGYWRFTFDNNAWEKVGSRRYFMVSSETAEDRPLYLRRLSGLIPAWACGCLIAWRLPRRCA